MDEEQLKQVAAQLRKPQGEAGVYTMEWMNKGNFNMHQSVLKVLDSKEDDNILELGMANGFYVKDILFGNPQVKYSGCDFSELMIEEALTLNSDFIKKGQASFIHADISSLPYKDALFNKVFTVNTIYFWEDVYRILVEIKRVLKADGQLIIALRPKHYTEKYPFIKYGFNQFSKEDVTKMLLQHGFIVTEIHENPEPDFEMNGEIMKMENLIVVSAKEK